MNGSGPTLVSRTSTDACHFVRNGRVRLSDACLELAVIAFANTLIWSSLSGGWSNPGVGLGHPICINWEIEFAGQVISALLVNSSGALRASNSRESEVWSGNCQVPCTVA